MNDTELRRALSALQSSPDFALSLDKNGDLEEHGQNERAEVEVGQSSHLPGDADVLAVTWNQIRLSNMTLVVVKNRVPPEGMTSKSLQ
jgi:hypothetical protein